MYDAEQRMKEIMDAPQLSAVEKRKLYSDQLNRFLHEPKQNLTKRTSTKRCQMQNYAYCKTLVDFIQTLV
jgi:hypothetical protein